MQWEQLTADDFARAVAESGVCLLPMGVLERHSTHLPLGTDMLNSHRIACLAAEREPAIVFPQWYFGQIYEARCFPGTVTIAPTLLLSLVEAVLDEIARNGLHKIIIVNGHGGNNNLLGFLAQCSLWQQKPYALYLAGGLSPERQAAWKAITESEFHGHACECETSVTLANVPELVHMERVPQEPALPLGRMAHVQPSFAGISWYANHPEHYAGDARTASAEKGRRLVQLRVDQLVELIAAVKADQATPALESEFFQREASLRQ
ncbi:MAG: creatininase family protein [Anaerolineae bacterium]|jgi:creatinine amidohydrolase|nr:creatininase family protein [Chloroflexota bacterium]